MLLRMSTATRLMIQRWSAVENSTKTCVYTNKRAHTQRFSHVLQNKRMQAAKVIVSGLLRVSSEILNDHSLNESQDIITCWSPLDRLIIKILMEYQSYNFGPVELFTKLKPLTLRSIRYETQ